MAAISSLGSTLPVEILPELVNPENECESQQKKLEKFRLEFGIRLQQPCDDGFRSFINRNITVRCYDGKIRFQRCYHINNFEWPVSPLTFQLCNDLKPTDHTLFLLEKYPQLMHIEDNCGVHPTHYFLHYLQKWRPVNTSSEKIKKIFKILIYSESILHHEPIEDFGEKMIKSPLQYLAESSEVQSFFDFSLCTILRGLIRKEKQNMSLAYQSLTTMPIPKELISIIHHYHYKKPLYYRSLEVIKESIKMRYLTTAIKCNNIEGVKLFLEMGANPENPTHDEENNPSDSCLEFSRKLIKYNHTQELETINDILEIYAKEGIIIEDENSIRILETEEAAEQESANEAIPELQEERIKEENIAQPTLKVTEPKRRCVIQ